MSRVAGALSRDSAPFIFSSLKRTTLGALLLAPALAQAQDGALSGPTGLLTVPTARVTPEGTVRTGVSRHDAVPSSDGVVNYLFNIGFLPGLAWEEAGWTGAVAMVLVMLAVMAAVAALAYRGAAA